MQDGLVLTPRLVGEALKNAFDFPLPYGAFLVGLRGADEQAGVTIAAPVNHVAMRCRILVMSWDSKAFRMIWNLRGTTAPGLKWLRNPMNRAGTAMVAPGRHKAHRRGLHKGKPALQQSGPLVVWRDSDRDARLTPRDTLSVAPAASRLNFHASVPLAALIGGHSAGCIVPALGFSDRVYREILNLFHPTQEVTLFIVPFELLERAAKEPGFHCLMIGSQGPRVRTLQKRLGVAVDGDFGINTARALIKFQASAGVRADGICGPQTNKALGI